MIHDHQEALSVLRGLRLQLVGAAVDMLWIHFGALRTVTTPSGVAKQVGEWALHLQCPWRFVRSGTVLLASSDFYYVPGSGERYDFESDGESVFHRSSKLLNKIASSEQIRVLEVRCSEAGAFEVLFDGAVKLCVMPHPV
jgi:hypothetical protein